MTSSLERVIGRAPSVKPLPCHSCNKIVWNSSWSSSSGGVCECVKLEVRKSETGRDIRSTILALPNGTEVAKTQHREKC
ncbi:hypothetical protein BaRGS_00033164 [Batillaria attramentaria]|uniref:Uncharacterized protein n=1 Tax=Batillaria attramentaria TaxID=370345 RepID=A0ABD0JLH4_9CAEN